jgi:uncharacterized membrane protein
MTHEDSSVGYFLDSWLLSNEVRADAQCPRDPRPRMPAHRSDPPVPAQRMALVDAARGLAILQMVAYHFTYDLNFFGWIRVDLTGQPGFIAWRSAIVSQFLLLVGLGVGIGAASGRPAARFWRRWAQIAGAAALVSAASGWLFGPRLIWFGILHFVAVALVLVRPMPRLGLLNLGLGAGAVALGLLVHDVRFDPPAMNWIGLVAHKPATEDYVPLLPWIGVVLVGIGSAAAWRRRRFAVAPALRELPQVPFGALQWMGRWPLTIYLLHQPLLMGILALARMTKA